MTIAGGWIDASVPVSDGMARWPGDPPVEISLSLSIERGDPANVTWLSGSTHTGTHMDAGERILLRTRNSSRPWWVEDFTPDFVHIDPAAAELIATAGVRTLGVNYLSVGGVKSGAETHRALLGAGVWIIEALNLTEVEPGDYELICLPLRLVGADGAPARALVRARAGGSTR